MKKRLIFGYLLMGMLLLSGCLIQEAPTEKSHSLSIAADYLTAADSAIIKKFGKKFAVKIKISILTPDAILERVKSLRYNAEIDVILTQNQDLRANLYKLSALKPIKGEQLFEPLERQFNNKHHLWIPVTHDPLLVTFPKDTSGRCERIHFKTWHRGKDSIHPMMKLAPFTEEYEYALNHTHNLNWLHPKKPSLAWSKERIYSLSGFMETLNGRDSLANLHKNSCRVYLIDNKRNVTRIYTASLYSWFRNPVMAERFLNFYCSNTYAIATKRNQLPTRRNYAVSWKIRSANIQ